MSKAFTRESDDVPDLPPRLLSPSPLPPGVKNYLTANGARGLREELDRLSRQRAQLAPLSDEDADARRRRRALEERVRALQQSLHTAIVVPPSAQADGRVAFGATVRVRDPQGEEMEYRIVGVDETDVARGAVSWLSPVAKALLNAAVGDCVRFRSPAGEQQLEILAVRYDG